MISTSICIHFPNRSDVENYLNIKGFKYQVNDDELDVIVDDVPYELVDGSYQDPDEQLCEFYGLDYGLVNCIEMA